MTILEELVEEIVYKIIRFAGHPSIAIPNGLSLNELPVSK
jgi:hypothetical protein